MKRKFDIWLSITAIFVLCIFVSLVIVSYRFATTGTTLLWFYVPAVFYFILLSLQAISVLMQSRRQGMSWMQSVKSLPTPGFETWMILFFLVSGSTFFHS